MWAEAGGIADTAPVTPFKQKGKPGQAIKTLSIMDHITATLELSPKQKATLFGFVEKKFVRWHDLQSELVEDLASRIKVEMEKDHQVTFEAALEKVYKSYGIFGFARIVQEKQLALAQTAKRRWWSEVRSIFKWPRIILVLAILSIVATISVSLDSDLLSGIFLFIYVTISVLFLIYVLKDSGLQKRLLLMQHGAVYVTVPFIYEFVVWSNVDHLTSLSFSILLTVGILMKLTSFKLYRKVRSEAALLYPEAFRKGEHKTHAVQHLEPVS